MDDLRGDCLGYGTGFGHCFFHFHEHDSEEKIGENERI